MVSNDLKFTTHKHIDDFMQKRRNSSALAMLPLFCIKPSTYVMKVCCNLDSIHMLRIHLKLIKHNTDVMKVCHRLISYKISKLEVSANFSSCKFLHNCLQLSMILISLDNIVVIRI